MLESLLLGSLALSPITGEAEEHDLEALERRAYDYTESHQYAEAARVWAEIASDDATDEEQRGLAVMRAVSSDKLAFEAKGDAQHLCHAHATLVAYLDRGESEQAEYLQQFRPSIETNLEDHLGQDWRQVCYPAPPTDEVSERAEPHDPMPLLPTSRLERDEPRTAMRDDAERKSSGFVLSGAVLTGAGASLLAVMSYAWARDLAYAREIDAVIPSDGEPASDEALMRGQALLNEAKPYQRLGIATAIAGGALIGAGVGLLVHGTKLRRRSLSVSPHASIRGGGVSLRVHF